MLSRVALYAVAVKLAKLLQPLSPNNPTLKIVVKGSIPAPLPWLLMKLIAKACGVQFLPIYHLPRCPPWITARLLLQVVLVRRASMSWPTFVRVRLCLPSRILPSVSNVATCRMPWLWAPLMKTWESILVTVLVRKISACRLLSIIFAVLCGLPSRSFVRRIQIRLLSGGVSCSSTLFSLKKVLGERHRLGMVGLSYYGVNANHTAPRRQLLQDPLLLSAP